MSALKAYCITCSREANGKSGFQCKRCEKDLKFGSDD